MQDTTPDCVLSFLTDVNLKADFATIFVTISLEQSVSGKKRMPKRMYIPCNDQDDGQPHWQPLVVVLVGW